jgi:hypothetical protein
VEEEDSVSELQPKFKVGDRVKLIDSTYVGNVVSSRPIYIALEPNAKPVHDLLYVVECSKESAFSALEFTLEAVDETT